MRSMLSLQARPSLTGLFFTFYVGMIFLVCMNVIIGIVTLYFSEVRALVKEHSARLMRTFRSHH